jgi:hypothetical protein
MTLDEAKHCVGKGWHPLLERLWNDLLAVGWKGEVSQVKEKFGGLRFYAGGTTDSMLKRILAAEEESLHICDVCGAPGKTGSWGGHWWLTLCPIHGEERRKEVAKMANR